jgi:hypothetical protein
MRLVDFLIHLLEAHAHTLQRLAAMFGEEILVEMLEQAGDEPPPPSRPIPPASDWLDPAASSSAYSELEAAVHDLRLPPMLEFHLWAYPHYRAFIEAPLELSSRIRGPGGDTGLALVDEAVAQAQAWVKRLPIPPELGAQAERAAQIPWLRFRTDVLKRIGKRPLGPAY